MFERAHKLALYLPAELAHNLSIWTMQQSQFKTYAKRFGDSFVAEKNAVQIAGLDFFNPIGLAAGLDKNAQAVDALSCFGFSFLEVGTVTPRAQQGNPKPRLFRIKDRSSLLNRMGFNNLGKIEVLNNIKKARLQPKVKIGVNIGKNKLTANENAFEDYKELFDYFHPHCDYITINVSSPNTAGLRTLQNLNFLQALSDLVGKDSRVFLKLAPDMPQDAFIEILEASKNWNFKALVLTNTLNVESQPEILSRLGAGGISGGLLRLAARGALITAKKYSSLPIISVGGIDSVDEVKWRLDKGADLVQIYTAFVYQGPHLIKNILAEL